MNKLNGYQVAMLLERKLKRGHATTLNDQEIQALDMSNRYNAQLMIRNMLKGVK